MACSRSLAVLTGADDLLAEDIRLETQLGGDEVYWSRRSAV